MSSADGAARGAAVVRARRRGALAAGAALLGSVGLATAAISRSLGPTGWLGEAPPGVLSLVLLSTLAVAGHAVVVEWRARAAAASAAPVVGRLLIGAAFLVGPPCAWISYVFEVLTNIPPDCPAPLPVPGGIDQARLSPQEVALLERCEQLTTAELAGVVAWAVVVAATAALLIAGLVMARRSRLVGWVAIPAAVAGCVVAFDLGHAVALIVQPLRHW